MGESFYEKRRRITEETAIQMAARAQGVTTVELADVIGVTRVRAGQILHRLTKDGVIRKTSSTRRLSNKGRPSSIYTLKVASTRG